MEQNNRTQDETKNKITPKENFFIGLSLSFSANHDSSVCVIDRNLNICFIDKLFLAQDIDFFFSSSPYVSKSAVCASIPYDNKLLEGKWRIHSKNYKPLLLNDQFKINRDDWTNRISRRCAETINKLKHNGLTVIRTDIRQLRMSYNLSPYCQEGTSLDCKDLQNSIKLKFNLSGLPDSMLSASNLEAIICAYFVKEYTEGLKTKELFRVDDIPVLTKALY